MHRRSRIVLTQSTNRTTVAYIGRSKKRRIEFVKTRAHPPERSVHPRGHSPDPPVRGLFQADNGDGVGKVEPAADRPSPRRRRRTRRTDRRRRRSPVSVARRRGDGRRVRRGRPGGRRRSRGRRLPTDLPS